MFIKYKGNCESLTEEQCAHNGTGSRYTLYTCCGRIKLGFVLKLYLVIDLKNNSITNRFPFVFEVFFRLYCSQ